MSTVRPGDPVWVDLYTADPDRSIAFYGDLFGWTAERNDDFGGYLTFRKDGLAVAGGMGKPEGDADPDLWSVYLAAHDARAVTAAAVSHGGSVLVEPMDVADLGVMAVLGDPGGASVGVWQAGTFPGIETDALVESGRWRDCAGAPSWFELNSRAYDAALAFYRDVFGWSDVFVISDDPAFRYSTIHATSPMLGGVADTARFEPGDPALGWGVYFGADDVDKTVERVVELGGQVVNPPENSPYGRMATVLDPTGARFNLGGDAD